MRPGRTTGASRVRVLQCNLGRGFLAQRDIINFFQSSDYNVLLLQEPYTAGTNTVQCVQGLDVFEFPTSGRVKACVIVKPDFATVIGWTQHSSSNLAIIRISLQQRTLYIASAYIEPREDLSDTADRLDAFLKATSGSLQVVGMDANGRHQLWNCDEVDGRGDDVANIAASNNLCVLNVGDTPTFQSSTGSKSIIDVTLASENLVQDITDWQVNLDAVQTSDHNAIDFTIYTEAVLRPQQRTSTFHFNNKTAKWDIFHASLKTAMNASGLLDADLSTVAIDEIDAVVQTMTNIIQEACRASMKIRGTGSSDSNPWWTQELDALKKESIRLHHILNRQCGRGAVTDEAVQQHQAAKAAYGKAVRAASVRSFRSFCSKQGKEDVWSLTNRLIKDAPKRQPASTLKTATGHTTTAAETASELLHHFYPDDTDDVLHHQKRLRQQQHQLSDAPDEPPFVPDEVVECIKEMSPDKAPGH